MVVTVLEIWEVVSRSPLLSLLRARNSRDASLIGSSLPSHLSSDKIWIVKTYEAMNAAYPHPGNSLRNAAVGAVVSFLLSFVSDDLNQTTSRSRVSFIELTSSSCFCCLGE